MSIFSERIRALRREKGMTQKQVAEYLGLQTASIISHEADRKGVKQETLIKYAKLYGVSTDYLLGLKDERN